VQDFLYLCTQPIKRPVQVRRTADDENPHRRWQRQHVVRGASSTCRGVSLSAPAGTRVRRPLCATISKTAVSSEGLSVWALR